MLQHLKELRQKKGLTLAEVAHAMGTSRQNYSFYENNQRDPSSAMIKALAKFYGVTTDYLLGNKEPETKRLPNDPQVQELVTLFDNLSEDKKTLVLALTHAMQETKEIVTLYDKLPEDKKTLVLTLIRAMQEIKQN